MSINSGRWQDQTVHISLIPSRLSLTLERGGHSQVYNFDHAGRPWSVFIDQVTYQRGLNGKIVAKWVDPQNGRSRRWLGEEEIAALENRTRRLLEDLRNAITSGEAVFPDGLPQSVNALMLRAETFIAEHIPEDIQHYSNIYQPIGILPPDQYLAVVLQATEGCSFNSCTFCSFYKDRQFRIKNSQEFQQHTRAVHEFLGEGLSLRRTIFFGDANALVAPTYQLLAWMEITREVFDINRLGGIYAFLDGFSGLRKSIEEYKRLRESGLDRVYIGLESGHEPLLRFLKKPGSATDALQAVQKIKAAGIAVGVIVLLGAGGERYAHGHIRDSIRLLNAMQLDQNDQIFFSELIEHEEVNYLHNAYRWELKPLSSQARLEQGEKIERGLLFEHDAGSPHICRYDIREFVY